MTWFGLPILFRGSGVGLATGRWRSSLERLRYQNAFDFQLYKIEEVVFYVSIKIKDLRIPKVYDFDTKSL